MEIIVEFNDAAFDHGFRREDILNALNTKIRDISMNEFPEKNLIIGFDCTGNPLEILYNPLNDNIVYIFHTSLRSANARKLIIYAAITRLVYAMKLRESTKKMAGL